MGNRLKWIPVPRFHEDKLHGNDKPRRMSFSRKWESREGYLAYYPIIYLTFIMWGYPCRNER
jgi:hypothetical protein